jgi:hypothetical protein
MSSVGLPPDFFAVDATFSRVSSSRVVLLRRHDSKMSSRGDAPLIHVSSTSEGSHVVLQTSSSAIVSFVESERRYLGTVGPRE